MKGCVYDGQLISVNTETGHIEVMENDGESYLLPIDSNTRLRLATGWETLLGEQVEVIVIDSKVTKVSLLEWEE
jgi:hypothetical protein